MTSVLEAGQVQSLKEAIEVTLLHFEQTKPQSKLALDLDREISKHKESAICHGQISHTAFAQQNSYQLTCIVNVLQSMQ